MSAASTLTMAIEIEADSLDECHAEIATDIATLIESHGLVAVLDMLRGAADGAIDAHDDDPAFEGTVGRLRTFSIAIATARGALS